jgi:hypothetical protein
LNFRITAGWLCALASTFILPHLVQAEDYPYSVGLGFEFSSGKYGSNTRTDSVYAPLTVTASPSERFGLALEVPFIYQSNGNLLTSINRNGTQTGKTMMMPSSTMDARSGSATSSSLTGTSHAESGLGDITLKAGYILLQEKDALPQIRPLLFVKFPTADQDKALGTGEFDEGASVEASKWFGDWNPFAEAGYTVQGRSGQFHLKNYLTYNAGVGYQAAENLRPLLLIKGTSAPADGVGSLLEVRFKLKYQATGRTGIEGYLAKGLTTSSADYGVGLSAYYSF